MAKQETALQTEHERLADLLKITRHHIGASEKDRVLFGDDPALKMDTISTDVPELDRILGGGWRRGRMGMVIGEAAMGKTLVTQWTIAAFQRRGLLCAFMDPEKTFDAEWFAKTGVDVEKLIVFRPENTEQAFDVACLWATNKIDLIVIDSAAALVPKMRTEHTLEEREVVGLNARKLNEGLAQLNNSNINSFVLLTNQIRSKVGVIYGSPDTIPGGKAQRFYASYIVNVRRAGWIPDAKHREGFQLKMTTEKNKLCPPFMEGIVPFMFTGAIDTVGGLIEFVKEFEVIDHRSGYFRWEGEVYHGSETFKKFLSENEASKDRLQAELERVMQSESEFGVETPMEDGDPEYNTKEEEF